MNNYLASFYIGETDGPDGFQISEVTQYVLENWKSKAIAKLVWENLEIQSVSIEENRTYDDDDGTYLFYIDQFGFLFLYPFLFRPRPHLPNRNVLSNQDRSLFPQSWYVLRSKLNMA
jgi:hypothetical protein